MEKEKELTIINSMIKETEKRILDIISYKVSYFEEEKKLYAQLEYLNNLCNTIKPKIISDTVNI